MDINELARKIREAIFDRSEDDGHTIHASSADEVVAGVLKKVLVPDAYGRLYLPVSPAPANQAVALLI